MFSKVLFGAVPLGVISYYHFFHKVVYADVFYSDCGPYTHLQSGHPENKRLHPVDHLRKKVYLTNNPCLQKIFPDSRLRIMIIDLDNSSSNHYSIMGQLDVASIPAGELWNIEKQEEMEIRLTGKRKWTAEMFPAGPISGLFGRKYGRDDYSYDNLPHAVIIRTTTGKINSSRNLDLVRKYCEENKVPVFFSQKESLDDGLREAIQYYKKELVERYLKLKYDEGSNDGFRSAQLFMAGNRMDAYQEGYRDGKANRPQIIITKDNGTEYARGFNDGYREGKKDGYSERKKDGSKTNQANQDLAFAKGYEKGLNENNSA